MLKIEAEIYLNREDEGGMTKEGFSGMMPSFNVENNLIMCRVTLKTKKDVIERGEYHKVSIELPYGEEYRNYISAGYCFTLNTGKKIIAKGTVTSMEAISSEKN
ncbi:hypothetical protein [Saccharibacillus sacchari]|uniref:Uncharacterized protein n=1 Tax=Saccharibacillus sacchari TaxID=456493 RepID=A0ACC6PKF0_9BACL